MIVGRTQFQSEQFAQQGETAAGEEAPCLAGDDDLYVVQTAVLSCLVVACGPIRQIHSPETDISYLILEAYYYSSRALCNIRCETLLPVCLCYTEL